MKANLSVATAFFAASRVARAGTIHTSESAWDAAVSGIFVRRRMQANASKSQRKET